MTTAIRNPAPQPLIDLAAGHRNVQYVRGAQKARGLIQFDPEENVEVGDTVTVNGVVFTAKAAAAYATGTVTYTTNFTADDTVTINGVAFTAKASGASGAEFNIGGSLSASLDALVTVLNASVNTSVDDATYSKSGTTILLITHDTLGTAGNAFTLAASVGTRSGATLSGGVAAASAVQFDVGTDTETTIDNLATSLNASVNASVSVATYAKGGDDDTLTVTYDTVGTAGNAFTLATDVASIVDITDTLELGGADDVFDLTENSVFYITTNDPHAAFVLADADEGRVVSIVLGVRNNSGNAVVTPANLAGGTTLTLDAAGEHAVMQFLGGEWRIIVNTSTLA